MFLVGELASSLGEAMIAVSLSGLLLVGFQFQAIAQGSQVVERGINSLSFFAVAIGHRKQFSGTDDECSLSSGDAERKLLPICLE
jgi:hypothetical protein